MMGVESEQQGTSLVMLTCSVGYGEMEGHMILSGFYDPALGTAVQVDRMDEALTYLVALRDWTINREGPPPQNPWR